jgi:hypothetical protein
VQKIEANSSRKCTVTETGGKTQNVTFMVTAVNGEKYSYEVALA